MESTKVRMKRSRNQTNNLHYSPSPTTVPRPLPKIQKRCQLYHAKKYIRRYGKPPANLIGLLSFNVSSLLLLLITSLVTKITTTRTIDAYFFPINPDLFLPLVKYAKHKISNDQHILLKLSQRDSSNYYRYGTSQVVRSASRTDQHDNVFDSNEVRYSPDTDADGTNQNNIYEMIQATQSQISRQQEQIQRILELLKFQQKNQQQQIEIRQQQQLQSNLFRPSIGDENSILFSKQNTILPSSVNNTVPVYVFVDGTWLYYSFHERHENDCPIIARYGRAWQLRYQINWKKLPQLIELALSEYSQQQQQQELFTSTPDVDVKYSVRQISVFTSYKADTPKSSYRYQMYDDMKRYGGPTYDVHMMETIGKNEKCIDIQLAVEMVHVASSIKFLQQQEKYKNELEWKGRSIDHGNGKHHSDPNQEYDGTESSASPVAVLLTGDKDFIPAMIRTRQTGMRLALCSMKRGCNRALQTTPKDFPNVIWLEDYLDEIIEVKPSSSNTLYESGNNQIHRNQDFEPETVASSKTKLSTYTLITVINDFIMASGCSRVSSRDIGRYLKRVSVPTVGSILNEIKVCHGGLRQFLIVSGNIYVLEDENYKEDATDHSYWVSFRNKESVDTWMHRYAQSTSLSQAEKVFFEKFYSIAPTQESHAIAYQRTLLQERSRPPYRSTTNTLQMNNIPRMTFLEDEDNDDDETKTSKSEYIRKDMMFDKYSIDECTNIYDDYTVIQLKELCRERQLLVSGRKSELIDRLVANDKDDVVLRQKEDTDTKRYESKDVDDPELARYLQQLIQEYLRARRGEAGSRGVGRYLAANRPLRPGVVNDETDSALKELKRRYGSLASYLNSIAKDSPFQIVRGDVTATTGNDENYADPRANFEFQIKLISVAKERA